MYLKSKYTYKLSEIDWHLVHRSFEIDEINSVQQCHNKRYIFSICHDTTAWVFLQYNVQTQGLMNDFVEI